MLDNPTTATKHIDWPIIRHIRVPYYPLEDLRERIQTEIARDQPPGTFDISDPVHRILLPGGRRDYSEDADTIHIQRRKEVKKKTKRKVKKTSRSSLWDGILVKMPKRGSWQVVWRLLSDYTKPSTASHFLTIEWWPYAQDPTVLFAISEVHCYDRHYTPRK